MGIIQRPKGTNDVYDDYGRNILYIRSLVENIAKNYNFNYFRTPTFEKTEVFKRGVGDTTDIVQKETYDFTDRSGRNMTLRPEGTAGIVRKYIEDKLYTLSRNYIISYDLNTLEQINKVELSQTEEPLTDTIWLE